MGMFDYLIYKGKEYQTKDTPAQGLEVYELRGGELWFCDVKRKWVDDDTHIFGGYFKEVSHKWKHCKDFDGRIYFYRENKTKGGWKKNEWIEYYALFMNGKVIKFERVKSK